MDADHFQFAKTGSGQTQRRLTNLAFPCCRSLGGQRRTTWTSCRTTRWVRSAPLRVFTWAPLCRTLRGWRCTHLPIRNALHVYIFALAAPLAAASSLYLRHVKPEAI
jgi:hypothetical protein